MDSLKLLRPILLTALPAGLLASILATLFQNAFVEPLILQAETYEVANLQNPNPTVDLARLALTFLTTLIVACAYGLLLTGALMFAGERGVLQGRPMASGLLWGGAGFFVFHLAPAIGLPPELPGMPAADLVNRQVWWLGTVVCSAAALWLLFLTHRPILAPVAAILLVLPHVLGAPHPNNLETAVPAGLAAAFTARAIAASLLLWLPLGAAVLWLAKRNALLTTTDAG
ncbi:CbtA family protein [Limibacillus sp. MBR-115]|uniref:CbtA family protein n=1 Tax=Limibacillus sp. MBR-115 TaxID=3156465 RepID=UPI003395A21F